MKLYNHQKLGLSYLRAFDSFALFLEQGLGKTLIILNRLRDLVTQGKVESILIIGPKATLGAWERDLAFFPDKDAELIRAKLTRINYESVWRKGKGYDRQWDCIVLDESQKIKNRTTKQSQFILKLALKSKYRYILTGTPVGNGQLENIWSQYTFLYPKIVRNRVASEIFGTYKQFEDRYCVLNQYWQPYRYLNVDELQNVINEYSYRATKVECLDLPDKLLDEVYDIELQEKKLYKEVHQDSVALEYGILADNPLAKMLRLRQICSGHIKTEDGDLIELRQEKIKVLDDFLTDWTKKLVIFCNFRYSIDQVSGLLAKLKIKHVTLDGRQKDKSIWRKFQSDESIRVIICQYQSAAMGVDLFAADTMLFYEPTLSSNLLEQARDRIHRIGQNQKCSYIHFVTKGTVETAIYKALQNYSDFSKDLFEVYMKEYTRSYAK